MVDFSQCRHEARNYTLGVSLADADTSPHRLAGKQARFHGLLRLLLSRTSRLWSL